MKKILPLFTITLFFFLSTHTSDKLLYTVIFNDRTKEKYPAAVIEQLPMVKAALENSSTPKKKRRTLDLSRLPITKYSFDIITERICTASTMLVLGNNYGLHNALMIFPNYSEVYACSKQERIIYSDALTKFSAILSDKALLETITAADYLLKGTHPSFDYFLKLLVAKTRARTRNARNCFYEQFTNLQAELFMLHVKQEAGGLSRFLNQPLINLILLYAHGVEYPENEFPVPSPTGQPVLGPFPLSIQNIIDAKLMPLVDDNANLPFEGQGLTSLTGLQTLNPSTALSLSLHKNHLTDLELNAFKGFPNLQKLTLDENEISGTSLVKALHALPALQSCSCLNNPITEDEEQLLQSTFPKVVFSFGNKYPESWV